MVITAWQGKEKGRAVIRGQLGEVQQRGKGGDNGMVVVVCVCVECS